MRPEPLRLEQALTMDYINRAKKMREIERQINRRAIAPWELTAYWVALGIALTFIMLNW